MKRILILAVAIAIVAGWIYVLSAPSRTETELFSQAAEMEDREIDYYSCAMHPQVRADEAGDCPICGMKLYARRKPATDDTSVDLDTANRR